MPSKYATHSLTKTDLLSPKRLLVSIACCTLAEKTVGSFTFVTSNRSFGYTKQIKHEKVIIPNSLHFAECQAVAQLFSDPLSSLNSQEIPLTPMQDVSDGL